MSTENARLLLAPSSTGVRQGWRERLGPFLGEGHAPPVIKPPMAPKDTWKKILNSNKVFKDSLGLPAASPSDEFATSRAPPTGSKLCTIQKMRTRAGGRRATCQPYVRARSPVAAVLGTGHSSKLWRW